MDFLNIKLVSLTLIVRKFVKNNQSTDYPEFKKKKKNRFLNLNETLKKIEQMELHIILRSTVYNQRLPKTHFGSFVLQIFI